LTRTAYSACILALALVVTIFAVPVHGSAQPSIPINGRFSSLVIKISIPPSPAWAHDVVMNATVVWNMAQVWQGSADPVYTFIEANDGSATAKVSYDMPKAYAGIAVGWTKYKFEPGSRTSITSTQTYLDPNVFNAAQAGNLTARQYAFWLAIHELGRILGLGSILDSHDIMDPMATPARTLNPPMLSTLDLYAVHVLASGSAPAFVTLPDNLQNQMVDARTFLSQGQTPTPVPEFNGYYAILTAACFGALLLTRRRRK